MLIKLRRGKQAQSLVIVALSATVLFGIIALGLDGGRLYFERRDTQNAADAAALAGAQELIPTTPNSGPPTLGMTQSARCQAAIYAFKTWSDVPAGDPSGDMSGCSVWSSQSVSGNTAVISAASAPATVRVTTPSRGNLNEIAVEVDYDTPLTFAAVIGFTKSTVAAIAFAHAGFYNKNYTIFGFDASGSGNSVSDDRSGWAQIDNGLSGTDCASPDPARGKMVSNDKFHAPTSGDGLNFNGQFYHASAADTQSLTVYWEQNQVSAGFSPIDPTPNYSVPNKPTIVRSSTPAEIDPARSQTFGSLTLMNNTSVVEWVFQPGLYSSSINIPQSPGGSANDRYIFLNGVYWFSSANFTISGGIVGNTKNGAALPLNARGEGSTDLPPAADGTNGVEFVLDGASKFTATSGGSASPNVYFVAPSYVAGSGAFGAPTDSIAFFVAGATTPGGGDSIGGPPGVVWSETIDRTKGSPLGGRVSPFQVWGSIVSLDQNGSQGADLQLTAVSPSTYAVTGELIGATVDLYNGGFSAGATPTYNPPRCSPGGYNQGQRPAGYLVQFNPDFAPHFHGLAYLVK
jgi:Flp pilus assembly protein TadG